MDEASDKRLFESILYGLQGTAMPAWIDYGLTNQDVGDLVNFIRKSNQKPSATPAKQPVARSQSQSDGSDYVRE